MKNVSFADIYVLSHLVAENNLYKHFHYPEMPARYDSNFIEFKQLPSLTQFEETLSYLREYHKRNRQNHVKFVFPANEKLTADLFFYLIGEDFSMGTMELYAIEPKNFPTVKDNRDIEIQLVTEDTFDAYLDFQYQQDLMLGKEFADQKIGYHKRHFRQENVLQVIALYKGKAAGSVDVILSPETAEIDGLAVEESLQRMGIGSRLQKFVMENFPEKTVFLVADGEDSPREMYKKQNYTYKEFRHEVQKINAG